MFVGSERRKNRREEVRVETRTSKGREMVGIMKKKKVDRSKARSIKGAFKRIVLWR